MKRMIVLAALVWASGARGAESPMSIVTQGTAEITRLSTTCRLRLPLVGTGDTVAAALEQLNARRDAAEKKLVQLGIEPGQIKREGPDLVNTSVPTEPAPLLPPLATGDAPPKMPAPKPKCMVTLTLRVDRTVPADSAEKLFVAALEWEDRIREGKIGGEYLDSRGFPAASDCNCKYYGVPVFSYIAELDPKAKQELVSRAFEKARQEAQTVARSLGKELGQLQVMELNPRPANEPLPMAGPPMMMFPGAASETGRSVKGSPGYVQLQQTISATFRLN